MSEVFGRKGPGTLKSGLIADDITSTIAPTLEILVTRTICCYHSGENDEIKSAEAQEILQSRHDWFRGRQKTGPDHFSVTGNCKAWRNTWHFHDHSISDAEAIRELRLSSCSFDKQKSFIGGNFVSELSQPSKTGRKTLRCQARRRSALNF